MSLLDHRAVPPAQFTPAAIERAGRKGRFSGFFLINLNSPARLLAYPQIPVFHLRAALKDCLRPLIEGRVLLDAEVIADQIQSYVGHMPNRRNVSGTMPCRFDAVLF